MGTFEKEWPLLLHEDSPFSEPVREGWVYFLASEGNIDYSDLEISDPKVFISTFSIYWLPTSWQALVAPAL